MSGPLDGLLLVDKPPGMTSFGVIRRVRALCGLRKVGHTGTLDPFATGVLPLCLGSATRLAGFLSAENKTYEATLMLGVRTDTLDLEGTVLSQTPLGAGLTEQAILEAFSRFIGPIDQIPPMYSALKVGGKRLHAYAREGVSVPRKPRRVIVYALEVLSIDLPRVTFRVRCSKGTYVRVLAADVGDALGCGAHLVALRRTRTGPFDVAKALTLEQIEALVDAQELSRQVISPRDMLPDMQAFEVNEAAARRVAHGNMISLPLERGVDGSDLTGRLVRLCHGARLLAIGEATGVAARGGVPHLLLQPRTVLAKN